MPPSPTPRAAIYARYSSEHQREASLDDQIRICRRLIAEKGWILAGIYSDAAMSGASALRPDYQRLQDDARRSRVDVIVSESIDRISRDQEHIAAFYKQISFLGIPLITVAEGAISELHIGLKGTMSALYLKDLAQKTHRGLEGRVRDGKSAGGISYGYRVHRELRPDGTLITGERLIDPDQAAIVTRIFTEYASGLSARAIAAALNDEGIASPDSGKGDGTWGPSTISGNWKRGTGILNNELYIGRLVWNRQHFIKDPVTQKRQARPNPPAEWITHEVPELRIIDQDLWDRVKARQEGRKIEHTEREAWERRKPRFLLTGLVKCGCCGGGFSTIGKDRFGCSNSRNKGTSVCTNRTGITRQELEGRILTILSERLMDPELIKVFAAEYIAERNRLAAAHVDDRAVKERDLAKVIREQDILVNALLAGTPPERIKAKMEQLAARQKQLEQDLAAAPASTATTRIHPKMADTWQDRIRTLVRGLTEPDHEGEAREAIRGLIGKIVATPVPTKGKRMSLNRKRDVAALCCDA